METKVNELEQYSRKRNILVTGLDLHSFTHATSSKIGKQRTCSRTATADLCTKDNDDISESAIMRKNFVDFAKNKLNVPLLNDLEITAIHDLPKWKDGTQPVIVQLLSPDKKSALMRKRAMLRGSKVYINDHLSQTNSELFREARRLHSCQHLKMGKSNDFRANRGLWPIYIYISIVFHV